MASFSLPSSTNGDAQRLRLTLIRGKWEENWKKGKGRTKKEKRFNKSLFLFYPINKKWRNLCLRFNNTVSESGWVVSITYIQIWSRLRRTVLNDRWHQPVSNPGSCFFCILDLFISIPTHSSWPEESFAFMLSTPTLHPVTWFSVIGLNPTIRRPLPGLALHFCSRNISVFRSLVCRHFFWILIQGINDKSV